MSACIIVFACSQGSTSCKTSLGVHIVHGWMHSIKDLATALLANIIWPPLIIDLPFHESLITIQNMCAHCQHQMWASEPVTISTLHIVRGIDRTEVTGWLLVLLMLAPLLPACWGENEWGLLMWKGDPLRAWKFLEISSWKRRKWHSWPGYLATPPCWHKATPLAFPS